MQAEVRRVKAGIREQRAIAPYAGYQWCYQPQAWYDRWREKRGAGRAGMYELEAGVTEYAGQDMVVEALVVLSAVVPGFAEAIE